MNAIGIFLILLSCNSAKHNQEPSPSKILWYDRPAEVWTEALPVGNGRLGAMVYGKTEKEVIQFNEETLWTGQPNNYAHKGAHHYLDTLRQLLWDGKQSEAHQLGNQHFMSVPLRQLSYQPFGNILLDFPGHQQVENYKRHLNLKDAICSVSYDLEGVSYSREIFSSAPDQAVVINLKANKKGSINFKAGLNSPHSRYEVSVTDDVVLIKGRANNYADRNGNERSMPESEMTFEARLKVIHDGGELIQENEFIQVNNANSAMLVLVAATNFINYNDLNANPEDRCKNYLSEIKGKSYKVLKLVHMSDYRELYSRVQFDLGSLEISHRPTNERLATFSKDEDPSLVALLYQFGRYLLISSSRPGTQPANLQGIWNDELAPAWDSKYTININAEMNYWPAEITNLSELAEPIIKLTEDLSKTGKNIAREHYDLEGWVAHHNTDIWRGAAPINNANHGLWPTGGAWLCQLLWWHYQFTGDMDYLENMAYPILRDASLFFSNYLIPDDRNPDWLISGPSNSPELGGMVMGPTMDHQIIRNLFANTIEAAGLLGVDYELVADLEEKRGKIAPNQIGQYGQLQEWIEDQDDPENKHRHVSHLWGLHPGNEIHPLTTPELAEACKVTLAHRGDGGTGWSRAWKINFWARLLDGDHAFLLLKNLMVPAGMKEVNYGGAAGGLYPNLFDAHPPFQIDGNFGATSGITEMLLQSHLRDDQGHYFQDVLPALPSNLSSGKIRGIKGRGGFKMDITWNDSELVQLKVKSLLGNKLSVRYDGKIIETETKPGQTFTFNLEDFSSFK